MHKSSGVCYLCIFVEQFVLLLFSVHCTWTNWLFWLCKFWVSVIHICIMLSHQNYYSLWAMRETAWGTCVMDSHPIEGGKVIFLIAHFRVTCSITFLNSKTNYNQVHEQICHEEFSKMVDSRFTEICFKFKGRLTEIWTLLSFRNFCLHINHFLVKVTIF